jgi:putative PIN family toxin of toxin-antitoxin system
LRAVVDTNVWVSGFLNPHGAPARIRLAYRLGLFVAVISQPLLDELADVLSRPKLTRKYAISSLDVDQLLQLFQEQASIIPLGVVPVRCRDPKDDAVIETAILGCVDVLVSGDADLTQDDVVTAHLAEANIKILTVNQFVLLLRELEGGSQPGA